jgi:hypothetical protein
MTDVGLGEWHGVTVDAEGRVIQLKLNMNNLAGPLPSELQQLSALKVHSLYGSKLSGPVPAELGQLVALTQLLLNHNQLSCRRVGGAELPVAGREPDVWPDSCRAAAVRGAELP